MDLFDVRRDEVIKSAVISGRTTYEDALERFYPLIDRFEEQRKLQRPRFYDRLKKDILAGCIMPSITLAFVNEAMSAEVDIDAISDFIRDNISEGYVLDGMQRLNTLEAASQEDGFDPARPIFVNVIIAQKYDLLLYRMITLNNGQKPMTVRHQVEMLTGNLIGKMVGDGALQNITILKEKETEQNSPKGSFRMVDVASAYLAFLTGGPNNQNSRFIEEKLDEILVGKVMESGLTSEQTSFTDVLTQVDRVSANNIAKDWLRNENNLIGFTLGAKKSNPELSQLTADHFASCIVAFEAAFQAINPSKVNVGKYRRELSLHFIENIDDLKDAREEQLTEVFFELTAN
ncbi:hypothetical protein QO002_003285 [Pararhizobium capsulatum DSM 1112]|uniref:DUF262 domain-containing protein n=1 Tax=Pararhizobium capsulatum DSM 1112 TaxID=1121113 RepID=A0ABU0BSA9_9HYPH|nr:hypothetical protein [Pararhizobium capsulatum]MDQ0321147.1 hypothetical protein [Pararhizobium capsulatum DSM 1112]